MNDMFGDQIDRFLSSNDSGIFVLSDFDRTLTPNKHNGKIVSTSPSRFRDSGVLGASYTSVARALYERYYPYEMDHTLGEEEKDVLLTEWWTAHLKLIVEHRVHEHVFGEIVDHGEPFFRKGARESLGKLAALGIPFHICSSGFGDFIRIFLQRQNLTSKNIQLHSNMFVFGDDGRVSDFERPIFHSHSKGHIWERLGAYPSLSDRKRVIVLGDSLGDLTMTQNDGSRAFLTIGFCNDDDPQKQNEYRKRFDIVITGDGDFSIVDRIFAQIFGNSYDQAI